MTERTQDEMDSYRLHDFDDPQSQLSLIEIVYTGVRMPQCPHCTAEYRPLPMQGTAWGIEHIHEPVCPELA